MGVHEALREAGVEPGHTVFLHDVEWVTFNFGFRGQLELPLSYSTQLKIYHTQFCLFPMPHAPHLHTPQTAPPRRE